LCIDKPDPAGTGCEKPADNLQQGAFAAAAWADYRGNATRVDTKTYAL
jgi:hypothetical protein